MKIQITALLLTSSLFAFAQNALHVKVTDNATLQPLPGAYVEVISLSNGAITDGSGIAVFENLPSGSFSLKITFVGYRDTLIAVTIPFERIMEIGLTPAQARLQEIIVSSTRTDQHIEDLPLKVEVLGLEEMNEESTLVPGNVASLLGDLAVITIQRTNPINGNDAIRMQGLDPEYTLITRDGLPLYGGFSGSLGVLAIPPLDLKQMEIIKGSVSTLYGGGAIAGMINFISKEPSSKAERVVLLNVSTLKEKNINTFFSGKINARKGYTLFAGANLKSAADVNDDGFTEVPDNQNYLLHPRFFFELNDKTKLNIGLTSTIDNRRTGDKVAVKDGASQQHPYLHMEKTSRNVLDVQYRHAYSENHVFGFKTAIGSYQRQLQVPVRFVPAFKFKGRQLSSYSEASDRRLLGKHTLVAGANLITESFRRPQSDSVGFGNFDYTTVGLFAQDDWQVSDRLTVETGVRLDHHNLKDFFFLPRIAVFFKPHENISFRLASGAGYKTPNIFSLSDPDPSLRNNVSLVKAEHSLGVNADINYDGVWFDEVEVSVNQAFYFAKINNPLRVITDTLNRTAFMENEDFVLRTLGTDTYATVNYKRWELYLGYNHTKAVQHYDEGENPMPFNPQDKFSATLAVSAKKWRTGVEASYVANQYIYGSREYYNAHTVYPSGRVHDFWFVAVMAERKFNFGSMVINVENLLDSRQSKFERLVDGPVTDPVFHPVWAPLEGRVFNLSVKVNL